MIRQWQTPSYAEIPINAEIGGYAPDDASSPRGPKHEEDDADSA